MMSARLASSPGSSARALASGAATSSFTRASSCSVVSTRLLTDRGRVPVARSAAISARLAIVPEEPTATSTLEPADLPRERGDRGAHEAPAGVERPGVREVAVEEPAGEADGAELERSRRQHLASLPHEQLGAAAADVAQQQALLEHRHGLQHAEVDEPRLLHPGDHVHQHAGLVPRPVDEHVAVLRLAHGRRGHRGDGGVVHLGDLPEAVEGGHRPVDGVVAELPHVAGARAEADDLLLAIEDLEAGPGVSRRHPGDDPVDRVGADVDAARVSVDGSAAGAITRQSGRCWPRGATPAHPPGGPAGRRQP